MKIITFNKLFDFRPGIGTKETFYNITRYINNAFNIRMKTLKIV